MLASVLIQTLIFSGANNHDWRSTTPYLARTLEETGRFAVRVNDAPAGCSAATLAPFDLLVLNYNGARLGTGCEEALAGLVRGGKGLVVVHGAAYAFHGLPVLAEERNGEVEPAWAEYARLAGSRWKGEPDRTGHGKRHTFQVRSVAADHPILRGLPGSFAQYDELYHRMVMQPEARVLAVAYDAPEQNGTGKDEPILWTVDYGRGRVFHTTLGHDVEAMSSEGFRTTLARGAEWAVTGQVTQAPPPVQPSSLLVVTGGHDYDTSFYSLFSGWVWDHRLHRASAEGFGRKLDRYDAVVLYDMAQTITEEQKQNLLSYLDRGGGLVVLHHALASFQSWPEYAKLIGGKYRLKPEGDQPASTFQHDVWMDIRVRDGEHPVTRGLQPFRIYDEVYGKIWVAPESRVLLAAGEPVMWISPHPKARIVVIQLGHGPEAHRDPAYRRLVHQALRWAAGR
jgi:hypothetical protein